MSGERWKQEQQCRIQMARDVWETILDPIMTFAELARGYDREKGVEFSMQEISAVLRLLVLGGYAETKMQCAVGGSFCHVSGDALSEAIKNWDTGRGTGAEGDTA